MNTRSAQAFMMFLTMAITSVLVFAQSPSEAPIDLSCAMIVADTQNTVKPKAIAMLQEEIAARTGLWLAVSDVPLDARTPAIVLGVKGDVPGGKVVSPEGLTIPDKPEGFAIWTNTSNVEAPKVYLVGNDARGTLFAAGRLLRLLTMRQGELSLPSSTRVATAPTYEFRGHQMGYRNTANTYDLWNIRQYEQYIRDMVIFGTNSVELIQEGDPYVRDTRLLAMSQWSMNLRIAQLLDDYGLDVWLWCSLLSVVKDPKVYQAELDSREEFFREMPRIDGVMIPGGDPGVNHPNDLMPWAGDLAKLLHTRFPNAGLYISNQKFGVEERDAFYGYIQDKQPKWLAGVAYGPGSEDTVKIQRERTPSQYKIRRYPDITHNIRCQYPVPGWDGKHAQSLDREGVNPRPAHSKLVHNAWDEYANGFVSYSDGAHDDVNKMVWSSFAWDPNADLDQVLVDYGRVFFGEDLGSEVAKGLAMLEDNMKGFLITNEGIDAALAQWRKIGRMGGPELEENWRYQMYLFRALFDAYIRARLIVETQYEQQAYEALGRAGEAGVKQAIEDARAALAQPDNKRIRPELRVEIEDLGVKLLKMIGFQLSLDEPYLARNPERGALLDKVDIPLNDRLWLERQFDEVLAMPSKEEQLARLNVLVNWEDPGPGGFYDDLGNTAKQPHLVRQTRYEEDPGFISGPQESHFRSMDNKTKQLDNTLRYSWLDQCETVYYQPLLMHYSDLDPSAQYKVRVTYFGRYGNPMRLVADEKYEIHGAHELVRPPWPEEFDVPREATQDGQLNLAWHLAEGRGCQVAEVWLIKK